MDKLWLPYPEYAGHNPTDPNNYDWTRADAAVEQIIAAGSTPYLRFGHSKNHSSSGSCIANLDTRTPPDDFAVFAQVTKHILKHFLSGWDNGFTYDIEFVEVWNEFYLGEFWAGAEQCDDGRINGSASSCCAADCTFEPTGPANCDGELCTTGDSCDMGVCTPGDCRDGESCSVCGGSCNTTQAGCGCVFQPGAAPQPTLPSSSLRPAPGFRAATLREVDFL